VHWSPRTERLNALLEVRVAPRKPDDKESARGRRSCRGLNERSRSILEMRLVQMMGLLPSRTERTRTKPALRERAGLSSSCRRYRKLAEFSAGPAHRPRRHQRRVQVAVALERGSATLTEAARESTPSRSTFEGRHVRQARVCGPTQTFCALDSARDHMLPQGLARGLFEDTGKASGSRLPEWIQHLHGARNTTSRATAGEGCQSATSPPLDAVHRQVTNEPS
jgi:hypothetical protein